jgi:methionyl-tRNA synthetase
LRGMSKVGFVDCTLFHFLTASRFLADRFVEGTCPHCGGDVSTCTFRILTWTLNDCKDARGDQCDTCSRTLDAIELINPRCLVNKSHKVATKESAHMYIKLDAIQPQTEEWIKKSWKEGGWSINSVINGDGELVDARLKAGLRPSPVTRDLTWGVSVPLLDGKDEYGMAGKVLCKSPDHF